MYCGICTYVCMYCIRLQYILFTYYMCVCLSANLIHQKNLYLYKKKENRRA